MGDASARVLALQGTGNLVLPILETVAYVTAMLMAIALGMAILVGICHLIRKFAGFLWEEDSSKHGEFVLACAMLLGALGYAIHSAVIFSIGISAATATILLIFVSFSQPKRSE